MKVVHQPMKVVHQLGWLALVVALGCGGDSATTLTLEFRSDATDIDEIQLEVTGNRSGRAHSVTLPVNDPLPQTYVVIASDDNSESVVIHAVARSAGQPEIRRSLTATFSAGGNRDVTVMFDALCRGVTCADDCVAGSCSEEVDSGVDTSMDTGVDAECDPAMCDDTIACTEDLCVDDVCANTPRDEECADDIDCTVDTCTEAGCTNVADDALCAGTMVCDESLGCVATCGGAIGTPITTGGRYDITVEGDDYRSTLCGGTSRADGEVLLQLDEKSRVFINTHQGAVDTIISVLRCDGSELVCNDDADGLTSSMIPAILEAGTYRLVVDTDSPDATTIPLDIYISPWTTGIAGACGYARQLTEATTTVDLCRQSSDMLSSCTGRPRDGLDAVYYFVLEETRTVTIDTCSGCSDVGITLELRDVCSERLGPRSCGSPCPSCAEATGQSAITETLPAGVYYVIADSLGSAACGEVTLTFDDGA